MKQLTFVLVVCLFVQQLIAQNTDFRTKINAVFENTDLSQVPSGILYDFGLNLVHDTLYDGTIVTDNILSNNVWRSLYADLWSARVNASCTMVSIEDVNDDIEVY